MGINLITQLWPRYSDRTGGVRRNNLSLTHSNNKLIRFSSERTDSAQTETEHLLDFRSCVKISFWGRNWKSAHLLLPFFLKGYLPGEARNRSPQAGMFDLSGCRDGNILLLVICLVVLHQLWNVLNTRSSYTSGFCWCFIGRGVSPMGRKEEIFPHLKDLLDENAEIFCFQT